MTVALAVEYALNFQNAQSYQRQLPHERDRQRLLLEINNRGVLLLRSLLTAGTGRDIFGPGRYSDGESR